MLQSRGVVKLFHLFTIAIDTVCDEEIVKNDDNLESNLLQLLFIEKTSGLHAGTR